MTFIVVAPKEILSSTSQWDTLFQYPMGLFAAVINGIVCTTFFTRYWRDVYS